MPSASSLAMIGAHIIERIRKFITLMRHGEALVAHRVGAEDRHAVAHRLLDDGAADGDRLGLLAAALPRRARDQLLGLVGLQHDEAAVGLREDAEEAVHDLVEQLVHVELGLDGVADFEHGAEPLLGLDERVGRGRPLGHGGFHRGRLHVQRLERRRRRGRRLVHDRHSARARTGFRGEPEDVIGQLDPVAVLQRSRRRDGLSVHGRPVAAAEVLDEVLAADEGNPRVAPADRQVIQPQVGLDGPPQHRGLAQAEMSGL